MANTRFRDTTKPKTQSSGTSKSVPPARVDQLPQVLKYPSLIPDLNYVKDIFCYILPHPGHDGLSVLIYRQPDNDQVVVICGDWHGAKIDLIDTKPSKLVDLAADFVTTEAVKFYKLMSVINIDQAQFFFGIDDDGLCLYDVQLSLNKYSGPGMVVDVFGKIFRTPKTIKMEIIDARAFEYIQKGTGAYEGDLLIKPSRFRMFHDEKTNRYSPLYVEVKR